MQLHVKGKNLEVNDSIRTYVERKLQKLDRRVHELTEVEIELAVERNPSIADSQVAEATVHLKGHTLRARETARDMKAAIDELSDKLVRQVRDLHDKRVDGRRHVAASVAGAAEDAQREDLGASGADREEPATADPVEAEITES
jgi:putative sigma-54 modulation protein